MPPQAIPSCSVLPCLLVPLHGSRAASYDFSIIKMSRNANAWWTLGERRLVPRKTSYDWTSQSNPWSVSQILDSVSSFTLPAYQKVLFTLPNVIKIKGTHTLIPLRPTATTLGKHHQFFLLLLLWESMSAVPSLQEIMKASFPHWGKSQKSAHLKCSG